MLQADPVVVLSSAARKMRL